MRPCSRTGRFRREKQTKLVVRALRELVNRLFQRPVGPVNREVDVLNKTHPPFLWKFVSQDIAMALALAELTAAYRPLSS